MQRKIPKKDLLTFIFIEFQYLFDYKDFGYVMLNILNTYEGIRNSTDELYKLLKTNDSNPPFQNDITDGTIIMENVKYCFYSNTCLFENINITFENQKKYILEGPSGSGKTSLFHLLLKLIPFSSGDITIGGYSIKNIPTPTLRQIITLIPQRNSLFVGMSIIDNILYGTKATKEDLDLLLNQYPSFKNVLFHDSSELEFLSRIYDGSNVSGGQKRIIINLRGTLRTLSLQSLIVIIDEPIVGLNETAAIDTLKMINDIFQEQTVIMVEHELQKNTSYLQYLPNFEKKNINNP